MTIHILKVSDKWQARADKAPLPVAIGVNKSDVVNRTLGFLRKIAIKGTIFIHGLDGRILEKREVAD